METNNVKARIFIGSSHAYCAITTDHKTLDILLERGRSGPQSLLETAADWRAKAARLIENAELAEIAAGII